MEKKETVFADGFRIEKPKEGSPEFVKLRFSFKVEEFVAQLKKYENNAGWVNMDMLKSKDGTKLYATVNTFQPKPKEEAPALDDSSIPF